jgi:hypothetical protein
MSSSIITMYPLARLPTFGKELLTEEDRTMLQGAYMWLYTYDSRGAMPMSATASYSELWFMVQYMMQLQILYRDVCRIMPGFVEDHRKRYIAFSRRLQHSFEAVMQHNYSSIRDSLSLLATLQFNESV